VLLAPVYLVVWLLSVRPVVVVVVEILRSGTRTGGLITRQSGPLFLTIGTSATRHSTYFLIPLPPCHLIEVKILPVLVGVEVAGAGEILFSICTPIEPVDMPMGA
jgi:hypothetical protein